MQTFRLQMILYPTTLGLKLSKESATQTYCWYKIYIVCMCGFFLTESDMREMTLNVSTNTMIIFQMKCLEVEMSQTLKLEARLIQ